MTDDTEPQGLIETEPVERDFVTGDPEGDPWINNYDRDEAKIGLNRDRIFRGIFEAWEGGISVEEIQTLVREAVEAATGIQTDVTIGRLEFGRDG